MSVIKNKYQRPKVKRQNFRKKVSNHQNTSLHKSERQKKLNAKKKWKELQEKDGHFIFFLGNPGSSKSTILACMAKYFLDNYNLLQEKGRGQKSDNAYIRELIEDIEKGEFPVPTSDVEFESMTYYEIAINFPSLPSQKAVKVLFIELAGEDIKNFAYEKDDKISAEMELFFKKKKDKILFFSVLPFPKDPNFTTMHIEFLSRIQSNSKSMSIIASKWDLVRKNKSKRKLGTTEFIEQNYPSVYSQFSHMENLKIFPFSVGQVRINKESRKPQISKLILNDCIDISNWIFDQILIEPKVHHLVKRRDGIKKEINEISAFIDKLKLEKKKSKSDIGIDETSKECHSILEKLEDTLEQLKSESLKLVKTK